MNMDILTLGEKIKKRRKELNFTLKDLAGDRITPGQISLVETGKSKPSMDLLSYLASVLETPIEYLMESEETQAEKICTYYENISKYYLQSNNLLKADQYVENCIYYSSLYKLEYKVGISYYLKGEIYFKRGKYNESQEYYATANSTFIKLGKNDDLIESYLKLGGIAIFLKSYHSALSYFQQGEKVYNENKMNNPYIIGEIYYYLAFIYLKIDDNSKCINFSYLAKEEFRKANNKKKYANSLAIISENYAQKGEICKAIEYSKLTNDVYKQIGDMEILSTYENNLGKLFFELDNNEEALLHYQRAIELRQETKDTKIVETYINVCENYLKIKDKEKAEETLGEIYKLVSEDMFSYTYEYYNLAYELSYMVGDIKKSQENLLMAYKYGEGEKDNNKISEAAIKLGKLYSDLGEGDKALKYLNIGVDILRKSGIIK